MKAKELVSSLLKKQKEFIKTYGPNNCHDARVVIDTTPDFELVFRHSHSGSGRSGDYIGIMDDIRDAFIIEYDHKDNDKSYALKLLDKKISFMFFDFYSYPLVTQRTVELKRLNSIDVISQNVEDITNIISENEHLEYVVKNLKSYDLPSEENLSKVSDRRTSLDLGYLFPPSKIVRREGYSYLP